MVASQRLYILGSSGLLTKNILELGIIMATHQFVTSNTETAATAATIFKATVITVSMLMYGLARMQ